MLIITLISYRGVNPRSHRRRTAENSQELQLDLVAANQAEFRKYELTTDVVSEIWEKIKDTHTQIKGGNSGR